jgi:hypothetical protein
MSPEPLRVAYADPPYPGCAHLYSDHPDYAGEVDHELLLKDLEHYDGWLLHTSSVALPDILTEIRRQCIIDFRIMAWEPVIVKPCRKPEVSGRMVMRDWIDEPITLQRGLTGAKPERVCHWAFEVLGMSPDDVLVDLFPGSGAVSRAWDVWRGQFDFSTASSGGTPT